MKSTKLNLIGTCTLMILFGVTVSAQDLHQKSAWSDLDDVALKRMSEWHIPGMAIAVVSGDSTIFQGNYGYADVARKTKVTKSTLFAIGSCTKFFTTTALSILSDEKKIDFRAPVLTYYPELKLIDSLLQREVTVRDILSHRTGLESGDYIWYGANYTRKEILDRLVYLQPVAGFRDAFVYNNMMYSLAGTLIERQSNLAYEEFMAQRVFKPIQLTSTTFQPPSATTQSAYALPYGYTNNAFTQLSMPQLKGVEPAGAIWSSIDDMTKWIKFHLGNGMVGQEQVLSASSLAQLKKPIYFTGQNMRPDETEFKSYGFGAGFSAYKGNRVMYHTGVAGGYTALFAFLPEKQIGIVILTNTDTYLFAMMNGLFDRALGLEVADWNSAILEAYNEQRKAEQVELKEQVQKIASSAPIKDAGRYVGVYGHSFKKSIKILAKGTQLSLVYNEIEYPLGLKQENEMMAYDGNVFGEITVLFDKDNTENITGLRLQLMGQELAYVKDGIR